MKHTLTIHDHSRDSVGMSYVYPVISRRAGGLSIGINLNPNKACNWRCIYCQVPNLQRGSAPEIKLEVLRFELQSLLRDVLEGGFFQRYGVEKEKRVIRDIAISGNGEPTSAVAFDKVIEVIGEVANAYQLVGKISFVLITNGSLIHRPGVRTGLSLLAGLGGEIWFKVDSATAAGRKAINDTGISSKKVGENLRAAARLCPTWIQSCVFAVDNKPFPEDEREAYLSFLAELQESDVRIKGILLYGLARPSMQSEASRLSRLSSAWVGSYADEIRRLGLVVRVAE